MMRRARRVVTVSLCLLDVREYEYVDEYEYEYEYVDEHEHEYQHENGHEYVDEYEGYRPGR